MLPYPAPLAALVDALKKLPGVGPRSAERLALHLVQSDPALTQRVTQAMTLARSAIRSCSVCGSLTESDPCGICTDTRRNPRMICVVERAIDVYAIDKSGAFHGMFHVLGGKISPINGVEPKDLRIAELQRRVAEVEAEELILALATDVDGDATAYYLAKLFESSSAKVSRLAHGLPAGSGLDFADELTLSRALEGRRAVT